MLDLFNIEVFLSDNDDLLDVFSRTCGTVPAGDRLDNVVLVEGGTLIL